MLNIKNILTSDTCVMSMFVPLQEIPTDKFPLPEYFLDKLTEQSKSFKENKPDMDYKFASDSKAMTESQWQALHNKCTELKIGLVDVSKLEGYGGTFGDVSSETSCDKRNSEISKANYVDSIKLILIHSVGKDEFEHKDILQTDFDIDYQKIFMSNPPKIEINENIHIAFADISKESQRASSKKNKILPLESSMIYASKELQKEPKTLLNYYKKINDRLYTTKTEEEIKNRVFKFYDGDELYSLMVSIPAELKGHNDVTVLNEVMQKFKVNPMVIKSLRSKNGEPRQFGKSGFDALKLIGDYIIRSDESWRNPEKFYFSLDLPEDNAITIKTKISIKSPKLDKPTSTKSITKKPPLW